MATITITPGNSFTPTETVTSTKLNDLGSPTAALTAASIGTADIADDAITTPAILDANVTFAKLTDVIDDDTMVTATDTTLATSQSIKAYVDSNGITQTTGTAPYYGCRAWAFYNQLTDTVEASGNIASIERTSTGLSTVTFTEPMSSAFYSIQITGSGNVNVQHTIGFISGLPTATGFNFSFFNANDSTKRANNDRVGIAVFA